MIVGQGLRRCIFVLLLLLPFARQAYGSPERRHFNIPGGPASQ
jgi:hypothetical protein